MTFDKQNSLVFVSHTHGVWNNVEGRRKPSKRYGRLIRSPKTGLSGLLLYHKKEVFDFIESRVEASESEEESDEKNENGNGNGKAPLVVEGTKAGSV